MAPVFRPENCLPCSVIVLFCYRLQNDLKTIYILHSGVCGINMIHWMKSQSLTTTVVTFHFSQQWCHESPSAALFHPDFLCCRCHPGFIGMRCEHADLLAVVATNHRQQTIATMLVLCVIGCVLIMVLCTVLQ